MSRINPAYDDTTAAQERLLGRRITSITRTADHRTDGAFGDKATLTLDTGDTVELYGHDGGCACSAGCYELTELATLADVDNIITSVVFDDTEVVEDKYGDPCGTYRLFVVVEDQQIQLAAFDGDDGNGYYGTGYYLNVIPG